MASGSDPPELPRGLIGRTGTPSGKGARLPSLRGPRDLTLGGVQKRAFVPNIPARRNKPSESGDGDQSSVKPSISKQQKPHGRNFGDRGRGGRDGQRGGGRGRGRGRTSSNVIQTHSLFEQGPTEKAHKPSSDSGYGGVRSSSSSEGRVSVKKEQQDADSKIAIDHLLRDDFIDGQAGLEEEDVTLVPVKLPLEMKAEISTKTKPEFTKVKVKPEPMLEDDETKTEPGVEKKMEFQRIVKEESSVTCADLFSDQTKTETGELLFFQLPDTLPGLPMTTDEELWGKKSTEKKDADKDKEMKDVEKKMQGCGLDQFGEGLIGKLLVRKSGRVQMVLGNTALDVNMGASCGFLQDLVSVRVNGEHGTVSVLGHVAEHSLVCTPDFETMLDCT